MAGTYAFEIRLTRYKDHARRQSAPALVSAPDFAGAVLIAEAMLRGARDADPTADFEIASISHAGLGGPDCLVGWQTREEFAAESEATV